MLDERSKIWLVEHSNQISTEELISEYGKQNLFNGEWPKPIEVEDLGIYYKIKDSNSFNSIIGNPQNWKYILSRTDLFENWILPYAVLLFGKPWLGRIRKKDQIANNVPFPLLIESKQQERAVIAKIVEKISTVLLVYLEGKWYNDSIIDPSGYIILSLKNEFIKDVCNEVGYKRSFITICPNCLLSKPPIKVPLNQISPKIYSCSRCSYIHKTLQLKPKLDNNEYKIFKNVEKFIKFIGITCVCPSDNCNGYFVPLTCVSNNTKISKYKGMLKNFSISVGNQKFYEPPSDFLDFGLTCPFCRTIFTPKEALNQKSGFKKMSGFLTGLPRVNVWKKQEDIILDESNSEYITLKDNIVGDFQNFDTISIKQRLDIIRDELKFNLVKTDSINSLSNYYFIQAVLIWIYKYPFDADNYFFNTFPFRGRDASMYQTILYQWVNLLEENINKFNTLDKNIKTICDFKWFAKKPKFSGGPITVFNSIVKDGKIINNTDIKSINNKLPRLVKIYSIIKNDKNYISEMKGCEAQYIRVNNKLKNGDFVTIKALLMDNHPTSGPVQKILRLKTSLKWLIEKITIEEKTGEIDKNFWNEWKKTRR